MSEENSTVTTEAPVAPATTETPSAQGNILGSATAVSRPDYIPEKFWDKEKNTANIEGLSKSYKELESRMGSTRAVVPDEKSTPEEVNEFWKALGKPESVDEYEVKVPDGLYVPDELLNDFKKTCLENNIPKGQADKLAEWYMASQANAIGEWNKTIEEAGASLKKEWGSNYEKNLDGSWKALVGMAGEEDARSMLDKYGNDTRFIKMMNKINNLISEDSVREPTASMSFGNNDSMKNEFNAIRQDKSHPLNKAFWNASDAKHKEAVDRLTELKSKINWNE